MDAVAPRGIIGSGDHAPALPLGRVRAHDDGEPLKFRVVPLLHRRKKGVHVQVADDAHNF